MEQIEEFSTEHNGISYYHFRLKNPCPALACIDKYRYKVEGKPQIIANFGARKFGPELQFSVVVPKGSFKLEERNNTSWDTIEINLPFKEGFFLIQAINNFFKKYDIRERGDTMSEKINWDDFESKFFRLESGNQSKVTLSNWRQRERTFGDSETPRTTLVFDVLQADGKQIKKEWGTTSPALAAEFRPMIEKAEAEGRDSIRVILKRTTDKKYIAIDITEPQEEKVFPGLKK